MCGDQKSRDVDGDQIERDLNAPEALEMICCLITMLEEGKGISV